MNMPFCTAASATPVTQRLHTVPEPLTPEQPPELPPPIGPEIIPPDIIDPPAPGYPEPVREPGIPPSPMS